MELTRDQPEETEGGLRISGEASRRSLGCRSEDGYSSLCTVRLGRQAETLSKQTDDGR